MATTRQRGALGEAFACARLLEDGYRILERNWRSGKSEIDLIAQKGNVIAFIEVKTRAQDGWCTPSQALARSQQRRIILAAVAYRDVPAAVRPVRGCDCLCWFARGGAVPSSDVRL